MSSPAHTSADAPWKSAFLSQVAKLESPEFVFGSLYQNPVYGADVAWVPRLRYCIYRGMWAELPENTHNDAPKNERIYESDLPTFTTDMRTDKVGGLMASGGGHHGGFMAQSESGGGAPVEAVWWIKDTGTQWRMKGRAFVVGPDMEKAEGRSEGANMVKSEVGARMRKVKEGDWSWGKELTAHFGNCSPEMRGTWKNPRPGAPVAMGQDDEHKLGQSVTDLDDPVARKNFGVVIITPDEVEKLDISDPLQARRWKYSYVRKELDKYEESEGWEWKTEEKGDWEWKTEELWP